MDLKLELEKQEFGRQRLDWLINLIESGNRKYTDLQSYMCICHEGAPVLIRIPEKDYACSEHLKSIVASLIKESELSDAACDTTMCLCYNSKESAYDLRFVRGY